MSSIDVNSQLADLDLRKTDRLATEPVSLKDFVCKAIQSESVVKRVVDEMLREQTHSAAKHSAVVSHTNVSFAFSHIQQKRQRTISAGMVTCKRNEDIYHYRLAKKRYVSHCRSNISHGSAASVNVAQI